jgi:phosphoenolpyruvate synthase/pyruvate phosphate dikinase
LLEDGEILVCETTNPSWVTLFVVAGALVIDIGGALSHGAIVARELGIPCVINTRDGSRRLRTGDTVVVDGSTGAVELVSAAGLSESEDVALA